MAYVVTRTEIKLVKNFCFSSQSDVTVTCNFVKRFCEKACNPVINPVRRYVVVKRQAWKRRSLKRKKIL